MIQRCVQISQVWMTCFWKFGNISLTKTVEKIGLHQQDSEYWNHQKLAKFHSGVLMDRSNSKPAASPLKPWTSARIKIKFITKESSSTIIFVTVNMLVIAILLTYHKMILIMDIAGLFWGDYWLYKLDIATFQDSSPGPQFASPGILDQLSSRQLFRMGIKSTKTWRRFGDDADRIPMDLQGSDGSTSIECVYI